MSSSVLDEKYLRRLLDDLGRVSSARSGDAREYRGDKRDDDTIEYLQMLMAAKERGVLPLPKCLFKPRREWYAHGAGFSSRVFPLFVENLVDARHLSRHRN